MVEITVTIGIVTLRVAGVTLDEVKEQIDAAMFFARNLTADVAAANQELRAGSKQLPDDADIQPVSFVEVDKYGVRVFTPRAPKFGIRIYRDSTTLAESDDLFSLPAGGYAMCLSAKAAVVQRNGKLRVLQLTNCKIVDESYTTKGTEQGGRR